MVRSIHFWDSKNMGSERLHRDKAFLRTEHTSWSPNTLGAGDPNDVILGKKQRNEHHILTVYILIVPSKSIKILHS